MLYQLSYFRVWERKNSGIRQTAKQKFLAHAKWGSWSFIFAAKVVCMAVKNSRTLRQLLILLAALVGARLLFVALMPATYSFDLHAWLTVMDNLEGGGNPYRDTGLLNYPPFWLQILFGLKQLAKLTGFSPIHLIQATLVAGEAIAMCAAYIAGRRFFPQASVFPTLLVVGFVILSANYAIEYALFDSHGKFLVMLVPSESLMKFSDKASTQGGQTLIRLPMFLFYVSLFVMLIRRFREKGTPASNAPDTVRNEGMSIAA